MQPRLTILVPLFVVIGVVYAKDEAEELKKQIFANCRKESKIPESVNVDLYKLESLDELKDHKCLVKCVYDNFKIFKPDSTIDLDRAIEVMKTDWKTPENIKKYTPVIKDCLTKVKKGSDACEYAYDTFNCYFQGKKNVQKSKIT